MRYYIISGENSGDLHAANLVSELKNIDNCASFRAWGGDKLLLEKVSLAKHIKETSFMGIWSVFKNLHKIVNIFFNLLKIGKFSLIYTKL